MRSFDTIFACTKFRIIMEGKRGNRKFYAQPLIPGERRFQISPNKNGVAWFMYNYYMCGISINRLTHPDSIRV